MDSTEKRAVMALAGIFAFRMLGLFMILPVFAIYAQRLPGATSFLIGLALGVYGFTQALLQIPFGLLSDRLGRKPVIVMGLSLFILGSLLAAFSTSIYGIIFGRALQGAGAIGSTILALVADSTRDEQRTKAMATIGLTIGTSFSIAMVLGPMLNNAVGVSGIFGLTALLGGLGIVLVLFMVPTPAHSVFQRDSLAVPALFKSLIKNTELLRLDLGIFVLHASLTASFIAIPLLLTHVLNLPEASQWQVYLPVLILAFITMVPFIIIAEKKRKMKPVFIGAIATIVLSQLGLWAFHDSLWALRFWLFIFFTAFSLLEASLPSLISKIAPTASKGTAMGIYSSCQFLGIFMGGSVGGYVYGHFHATGIFAFCALLSIIWLVIALGMKKPPVFGTFTLAVGDVTDKTQQTSLQNAILAINGVKECVIIAEEKLAYLKVDNTIIDKKQLTQSLSKQD